MYIYGFYTVFYRWFLHFYVTGVVVNSAALLLVVRLFIYNITLPPFILELLRLLDSNQRVSTGILNYFLIFQFIDINEYAPLVCFWFLSFAHPQMHPYVQLSSS